MMSSLSKNYHHWKSSPPSPASTPPITIISISQLPFLLFLLLLLLQSFFFTATTAALVEEERMEEYHRRGHTWPPKLQDYNPSTPGWKALYDKIFQQLQYSAHESSGERYELYMSMVHSSIISQNFTEYGWGVTKAPRAVHQKLYERLHTGLAKEEKQRPLVSQHPCMETNLLPYFFHDTRMNAEIVQEMTPFMESWSGVQLIPNNAYGLRVYRRGSNLLMHLDKPQTHVISGILHVDHGTNDDPWPLVIEDFHGNTNEIFLEPGDLLLYESSKCRHGRPTKYNGEYYTSLFMHWYPKEWDDQQRINDVHYRIPDMSIWHQPSPHPPKKEGETTESDDGIDELQVLSLCMKEPECEHGWCRLSGNTLKFNGPRPTYGQVISGDGKIVELKNIPTEESFEKKGDHKYVSEEL